MIRTGVIGIGNISSSHLDAYVGFPSRCEVVALADIAPGRSEQAVERFGLKARCFDSHTSLLAEADVDLVSICTPPGTHAEITIDALESGRHVIVEKPMGASLEDCDRMLAAAERSGKLLSVVAQNRFRTEMMRTRKLLAANAIGKILHAQVDSYWWRGHSYYDLWWRGTWASEGGGCTLNHSVHHVDLLLWMMGAPVEVRAIMGNVAHDNSEVEDISVALLRFGNGAVGQLTSSVVHHGQRQKLVFQGERAMLATPYESYASRSLENGFPERDAAVEAELLAMYESVPALEFEGHKGQIDNMLGALEGRQELWVDGAQARATIELITATYESAIKGGPVLLPLPTTDPFYRREGLLAAAPHYHEKSRSVAGFADDRITTTGNY